MERPVTAKPLLKSWCILGVDAVLFCKKLVELGSCQITILVSDKSDQRIPHTDIAINYCEWFKLSIFDRSIVPEMMPVSGSLLSTLRPCFTSRFATESMFSSLLFSFTKTLTLDMGIPLFRC